MDQEPANKASSVKKFGVYRWKQRIWGKAEAAGSSEAQWNHHHRVIRGNGCQNSRRRSLHCFETSRNRGANTDRRIKRSGGIESNRKAMLVSEQKTGFRSCRAMQKNEIIILDIVSF